MNDIKPIELTVTDTSIYLSRISSLKNTITEERELIKSLLDPAQQTLTQDRINKYLFKAKMYLAKLDDLQSEIIEKIKIESKINSAINNLSTNLFLSVGSLIAAIATVIFVGINSVAVSTLATSIIMLLFQTSILVSSVMDKSSLKKIIFNINAKIESNLNLMEDFISNKPNNTGLSNNIDRLWTHFIEKITDVNRSIMINDLSDKDVDRVLSGIRILKNSSYQLGYNIGEDPGLEARLRDNEERIISKVIRTLDLQKSVEEDKQGLFNGLMKVGTRHHTAPVRSVPRELLDMKYETESPILDRPRLLRAKKSFSETDPPRTLIQSKHRHLSKDDLSDLKYQNLIRNRKLFKNKDDLVANIGSFGLIYD